MSIFEAVTALGIGIGREVGFKFACSVEEVERAESEVCHGIVPWERNDH
jgi:hypothetical protein